MFRLTYICVFLDFFFYPCYYDTVGKHNPDDTNEVVSCMAQSCNLLKRNLYLQITTITVLHTLHNPWDA
jgi:hypothetical protein